MIYNVAAILVGIHFPELNLYWSLLDKSAKYGNALKIKSKIKNFVETVKQCLFYLFYPETTFAEMFLFLWVYSILIIIDYREIILFSVKDLLIFVNIRIVNDFGQPAGIYGYIAAIVSASWTIIKYLWLGVICGLALLLPVIYIIRQAFRGTGLKFFDKTEWGFTIRFFYVIVGIIGLIAIFSELYELYYHPSGRRFEIVTFCLLGLFFLQRSLVVVFAIDDSRWAQDFFASRISDRNFRRASMLIVLPVPIPIYYVVKQYCYSILWAISLTYMLTLIVLQIVNQAILQRQQTESDYPAVVFGKKLRTGSQTKKDR